ncbi:MAG: glycine cleavage system aminomethyltransferase GcvT [Flaviflexus sp.]|nr:glycine cleavage system aminomethyltransferase GcvT [Flaviflexus sp.]
MALHDTALTPVHQRLGAFMTDFAGWNMPLRYSSDRAEHEAVRTRAGLFDLSHMGQIRVRGKDAGAALDHALVTNPSKMPQGRARYSLMVNESGGIMDDLIVYKDDDEDFLVVANAANRVRVAEQLQSRSTDLDVEVDDQTTDRALIACQGPRSAEIVAAVIDEGDREDFDGLGYYRHAHLHMLGLPVHIARTGYTGERGYEIMCEREAAEQLWEALMEAGKKADMLPCGLASRDTLRLEAGMPLYGHELTEDTTPAEAGQGRVPKFDHDFVGRQALESNEPATALYALKGEGRRAARAGCSILKDGEKLGEITSGVLSPTLGYPIAMALARPGLAIGDEVTVDVRGKEQTMTICELPFYKSTN